MYTYYFLFFSITSVSFFNFFFGFCVCSFCFVNQINRFVRKKHNNIEMNYKNKQNEWTEENKTTAQFPFWLGSRTMSLFELDYGIWNVGFTDLTINFSNTQNYFKLYRKRDREKNAYEKKIRAYIEYVCIFFLFPSLSSLYYYYCWCTTINFVVFFLFSLIWKKCYLYIFIFVFNWLGRSESARTSTHKYTREHSLPEAHTKS